MTSEVITQTQAQTMKRIIQTNAPSVNTPRTNFFQSYDLHSQAPGAQGCSRASKPIHMEVLPMRLQKSYLRVLNRIAWFHKNNLDCFESNQAIAAYLDVSIRTVEDANKKFRELNLVEFQHRKMGKRSVKQITARGIDFLAQNKKCGSKCGSNYSIPYRSKIEIKIKPTSLPLPSPKPYNPNVDLIDYISKEGKINRQTVVRMVNQYGPIAIKDLFDKAKLYSPDNLGGYFHKLLLNSPPHRIDRSQDYIPQRLPEPSQADRMAGVIALQAMKKKIGLGAIL